MLAGAVLLAAMYFSLSRGVHPGVIFLVESHGALLRYFAPIAAIVMTFLLVFGLLSGADQRSSSSEHVDLPLVAEEATETLLPLAEKRGITVETSADAAHTIGSHALLLQLATNLVHNAIFHNLRQQGSVWVTTSVRPNRAALTVENTGENLAPDVVATLAEPFPLGTERIHTAHGGVGPRRAIVTAITQA